MEPCGVNAGRWPGYGMVAAAAVASPGRLCLP